MKPSPAENLAALALIREFGPTWVRLGQLFALRPDWVDAPMRAALLDLHEDAPPMPLDAVVAIVRQELGADPIYASIEPRPSASRLVTQTHAAVTREGERVSVKVVRPDWSAAVEKDLSNIPLLRRVFAAVGLHATPAEALTAFRHALTEEADLTVELKNHLRFFERPSDASGTCTPTPYPELCSARVLTLERVAATPLLDVLAAHRTGHARRLTRMGLEPAAIATKLAQAVLEEMFYLEMFHTDLHPDRLSVAEGGRIVFSGSSLVDFLDPALAQGMSAHAAALQTQDLDRMYEGYTAVLATDEQSDDRQLRVDFLEASQVWCREQDSDEPPRMSTSRYVSALLASADRNRVRVPPAIRALCHGLLTADLLAFELGAAEDLYRVGQTVFERVYARARRAAFHIDELEPAVFDALRLLRDGPRSLRRVLMDLADGRMVLRVRTIPSDTEVEQANTRARLVTLAVLTVALSALITPLGTFALVPGVSAAWLLVFPFSVLIGRMLLLWRRLR